MFADREETKGIIEMLKDKIKKILYKIYIHSIKGIAIVEPTYKLSKEDVKELLQEIEAEKHKKE